MHRLTHLLIACCLSIISSPGFADVDSTVLITGGNRGLGLAFVEKYAARGWNVIATARRPEAATELQALANSKYRIRIEKLDITDAKSVDALAIRLDGLPIDVLLNNAGMIGTESEQKFGTLDADKFDLYMRTNALGALLVSERLLPNVVASEKKTIAGISALVASFDIYPRIHPGLYYYKASKVALNMILRNIAMDTRKQGVKVAILSPGVVNTYGRQMSADMPGLVDIDTSIEGMMGVLDELTLEGSGQWYRYTGRVIAW